MLKRYNVSETKKYYCDINSKVLTGVEVITYKSKQKDEVSHVKKDYMDFLLDKLKFNVSEEYDKELKTFTISVLELNMYGEGKTREEAINDLLDSIIEFAQIYNEKIDLFSKVESVEKQVYMMKILRSASDKNSLKKDLGLQYAHKI